MMAQTGHRSERMVRGSIRDRSLFHDNAGAMLALHAPAGPLAPSLPWLAAPASGVSAHYIVAKDGAVSQMVREAARDWHAGASEYRGRISRPQ